MFRLALILLLIFSQYNSHSQDSEVPYYYSLRNQVKGQVATPDSIIHLTYAALYARDFARDYPALNPKNSARSWFHRKLITENLFVIDQPDIYLTVDPIFDFSGGMDQSDSNQTLLYQNTRGVLVQGNFGRKVVFYTSFLENQARFAGYVNRFIENTGVVPGSGRVKVLDDQRVDYSMASAGITYNASTWLRLKVGYDKDFLGLGYRSILLSDNAFNYPHLKLDFWMFKRKLKYTLNYALLQDLERLPKGETPESLFRRKSGVFHFLNYKPTNSLEVGVFNGFVLPLNPEGENATYYLNYFMPIIFWNSLFQADQTGALSRIGLNGSWTFFKNRRLYGQWDLGVGNAPTGVLFGLNFRHLGLKNLHLTFEYSKVERYQKADSTYTFSHYNQSLAHPLGSGFEEFYGRIEFDIHRFKLELSGAYSKRDTQEGLIWGYTPAEADYQMKATNRVFYVNGQCSYLLNRKTNMQLTLGYTYRNNPDWLEKTNYIYMAFRTALRNLYVDF